MTSSPESDVNLRFQRAQQPTSNIRIGRNSGYRDGDDEEDEDDDEGEEGTEQNMGNLRGKVTKHRVGGEGLEYTDTEESGADSLVGGLRPSGGRETKQLPGDSPPSAINHLNSDDYALNTDESEDDMKENPQASPAIVYGAGQPQPPRTGSISGRASKLARSTGEPESTRDSALLAKSEATSARRNVGDTASAGLSAGGIAREASGSGGIGGAGIGNTSMVGLSDEIKELLAYIGRYRPQDIELEAELKPFIPDYIPAVGDIDAFIKIPRPDQKTDLLGLTTVDEPSGKQSDPTVLDLQLRALSKSSSAGPMTVHSIDGDIMKGPKGGARLEQWLKNIRNMHETKPPPTVHFGRRMPDVEELMQEWPKEIEDVWGQIEPPSADLNIPLASYARLVSVLVDIPVPPLDSAIDASTTSSSAPNPTTAISKGARQPGRGLIESLCVLFTLYAEFKNSQHFFKEGEGWDEKRNGSVDGSNPSVNTVSVGNW